MNTIKKNTIRRKDLDEIDDVELRHISEELRSDLPQGHPVINERFIQFGGKMQQLNDAASIASAGLVIAEQIAELTTAIYTLVFLVASGREEQ